MPTFNVRLYLNTIQFVDLQFIHSRKFNNGYQFDYYKTEDFRFSQRKDDV